VVRRSRRTELGEARMNYVLEGGDDLPTLFHVKQHMGNSRRSTRPAPVSSYD
jgi:hypothetical protein